MFFTVEQLAKNKETFIELIKGIEREGFKKEELLDKLEKSDFYTAPASTKYHSCFEGGLVDHCLCVYYNLKSLVKVKGLEGMISEDSIRITALLHDISKMNFYKESVRNKKQYSANGSKVDEIGNYDWVSVKEYTIAPQEERFIFGSHEETSEYIASKFVPLTYDESIAILNHMGGMGFDSSQHTVGDVFTRSKLAILLFVADMMSTYIDEYE